MKRRAQASLEYIITYGWAFLVILIVIGALAYFGVLNPSKWVPDDCDFGAQLECVDYQVRAGANDISLFVRNNFGKEIDITDVKITIEDIGPVGLLKTSLPPNNFITISAGTTGELIIGNVIDTNPLLFEGEKQRLIINITFKRGSEANPNLNPPHTIRGSLYTTTKA
ncbi:hypothetical protein GOV07_01385 [Candidatus Woesearchaeota archaeon]|nr:hypothetical protein [Candidatus Woesearchaeota archaeon]